VLWAVAEHGDQTMIVHRGLLGALGLAGPRTALDVWRHLAAATLPDERDVDPLIEAPLHTILARGPLARRLLAAAGTAPDAARLRSLCAELADCLHDGASFGA
jgi:carboxylate-amine ligase